ncbi:MAG: glycosyltransferase family 2 protein [Acidimicrobiales bacterium]
MNDDEPNADDLRLAVARWSAVSDELIDELADSRRRYSELTLLTETLRARSPSNVRPSGFRRAMMHVATVLLPVDTRRRKAAAGAAKRAVARRRRASLAGETQPGAAARTAEEEYRRWLELRTPSAAQLELQRLASGTWAIRPLVTVCVAVHDPEPQFLADAIASVLAQSYDGWELCLCDAHSSRHDVQMILEQAERANPRVRVIRERRDANLANATNRATETASGEFIAFLDHDAVLAPHALYAVVKALQSAPELDVLYSDDDVLSAGGDRVEPLFKPAFSPTTLLSLDYTTHLVVMRRSFYFEIGGMRSEFDGAHHHDLMLRASEHTRQIRHIPDVLYSCRASSCSMEATPQAVEADRRAVEEALGRRGIEGDVAPGAFRGAWRVRPALPEPPPTVQILIPTRDRLDLLRPCIDTIERTTAYPDYGITILDNDSRRAETLRYFKQTRANVVRVPGDFNYAAIINRGFEASVAEFVLTLNNDTFVLKDDWLVGLVEIAASQSDVGAVGCRLVFPDGRPQHEGIVVGMGGLGAPAVNWNCQLPGLRTRLIMQVVRDVTAVTGACTLVRRSAWQAVGGLDEDLRIAYNDVDFCLRLRRAGFRVLYTPHVTIVHDESASRGQLNGPEDKQRFVERWHIDRGGDPFFPEALEIGPPPLALHLVP